MEEHPKRSDAERREEIQIAKSVWDGLENEAKRQDYSHYRGVGRFVDIQKWEAIGTATMARLDQTAPLGFWDKPRVLLEWGPGGGSNIYALRDRVKTIFGVDISQKNLEEAAQTLSGVGAEKFRPILLKESLSDVASMVSEPVEIFVSTAVFQHFPTQAFGVEVLELMHELMAPGAIGLVQIRYDNGSEKFIPNTSLEQYTTRYIRATSFAIDAFALHLKEIGFTDISASDFDARINYVTFCFRKPGDLA